MSQKEAHNIHLIERRLDANCRECLIARVRTLRPEWRTKGGSGGYFVSDSVLTKLVMKELLDLKGVPMNDPDHGFETAFTVLGFRPQNVEEVDLMPVVDIPGTLKQPYNPGFVELTEFTNNLGKEKSDRPTEQGGRGFRASSGLWALLAGRIRRKLRGLRLR